MKTMWGWVGIRHDVGCTGMGWSGLRGVHLGAGEWRRGGVYLGLWLVVYMGRRWISGKGGKGAEDRDK